VIAARAKAKQQESGGSVLQKSEKPPIHTSEEIAKLAGAFGKYSARVFFFC
jgi:hypothetical protein